MGRDHFESGHLCWSTAALVPLLTGGFFTQEEVARVWQLDTDIEMFAQVQRCLCANDSKLIKSLTQK